MAVIDTELFGIVVGAVKAPEDVIVPVEGEPPATPFTFHVRLTRDPSPPDVVNCAVCPGARSPVFGVTVKLAGCRNSELLDDELPDAQPEMTAADIRNKPTTMERFQDRSNAFTSLDCWRASFGTETAKLKR